MVGQRQLVNPIRQVEGGRQEVDQKRRDNHDGGDLAGERIADQPADGNADPDRGSRIQPDDRRACDRSQDVAAGERHSEPDPEHGYGGHRGDRPKDADPTRDRPPSSAERAGEEQLEPAVVLVGGPTRDERRSTQTGDDEAQVGEQKLQETRSGADVAAGEDGLESL